MWRCGGESKCAPDLLPTLVGDTLIDDDCPEMPTTITGYELDEQTVTIHGLQFSVGGARRYFGIAAGPTEDQLRWYGYGVSGRIIRRQLPTAVESEASQ